LATAYSVYLQLPFISGGSPLYLQQDLVTLLFVDDQLIIAENENGLQKYFFQLNKIIQNYYLKILTVGTK
jgi:hypothetical protein